MPRGGKRPNSGRKPGSDNRTVRWPIRWTAGEATEIESAAEKNGQSPTDFIRGSTLERARRQDDSHDLEDCASITTLED